MLKNGAMLLAVLATLGATGSTEATKADGKANAPQAAAEKEYCQTDDHDYCTDRVVTFNLTYDDRSPEIRINTTLGRVTTIYLPKFTKLLRDPKLGNLDPFEIKVDPATPKVPPAIGIWPRTPEGAGEIPPEELDGEHTNLQILLWSGITIRIHLQMTQPDEAVELLYLKFPERDAEEDYARARVQELSRVRQQEYDAMKKKLHANHNEDVRRQAARQKIGGQVCEDFYRKYDEKGLLLLYVTQICREGNAVYIHLKLSNQARDVFRLGSVEVMAGDSDTPLDALIEWGGNNTVRLGYGGEHEGVAEVRFGEEGPADEYRVRATEVAGKNRVVVVDDIEF